MTTIDADNKQVQGYLLAIGKIVSSFGDLQRALCNAHHLFSDLKDSDVRQDKLSQMPLDSIINEVMKLADSRLSNIYKVEIISILDEAIDLKDERNANISGAWDIMINYSRGNNYNIQRYIVTTKRGDKKPKWNTATRSIESLEDLSRRVLDCASRLGASANRAYHRDPEFQVWLEAK